MTRRNPSMQGLEAATPEQVNPWPDPWTQARGEMMRPLGGDMMQSNPEWARWFDQVKAATGGGEIKFGSGSFGRPATPKPTTSTPTSYTPTVQSPMQGLQQAYPQRGIKGIQDIEAENHYKSKYPGVA